MKILLLITVLYLLISCKNDLIYYDTLTSRACDSLLKTTALSSNERAKVVRQYALLHTPGRGYIGKISSTRQDTCLKMLQEVIPLVSPDLRLELQITMLPFCLSKLLPYDDLGGRNIRKIMSDIESSQLTPQQEAWYLNYKAQFYTIQRASKEAFDLCEKARDKFRLNNDLQGEFSTLSQLSMLYLLQKDYHNALRYCDSAQHLQGYTPSETDQKRLYSQYSMLYHFLGNYNKAIEARQKSGSDTINNSTLISLYVAAKRYNEALNIIRKQEQNQLENPFRLNYFMRFKAEIYETAGEYDKAASLRDEAIRMAETNGKKIRKIYPGIPGIPPAFASIYATQAEWIWKKGKQSEAIALLQKAEILTIRSQNIAQENIDLLKQLTKYYKQLGDYRSAFYTLIRRDSIQEIYNKQQKTTEYEDVFARHELEMLDAAINKRKTELRIAHYSNTLIISSIILSLLSITLLILYCRNLKQLKKLLRSKEPEK